MKTPDNVDLIGFLHQPEVPLDDGLVVVLAHGHTQSHKEWADFEKILIDNGITTMAFDFRGHGESGGSDLFSTIGIDITTVVEFLKQRGYERIACIGSSMGGSACAAGSIEGDIDGLVMLSSPMNLGRGSRLIKKRDFQALSIPKIIMFTENDYIAFALEEIDSYYETADDAGEPKDVYIYPGIAHGSGLFYDEQGDQVITILLDFVKALAE
ncbi:MAG TPA: alpha/beta fold hydrolase [Anaerolineales bacterium]